MAALAKKILKTAFILIALRFLWFSMQRSTHSQTAGSLKNHQYKSKNLLQKKKKKLFLFLQETTKLNFLNGTIHKLC